MHKHLLLLLLAPLLVACGVDRHHFKIEGRILNMNQGEFYVYSTDGLTDGLDTIAVSGGRFAMELPIERKGTLMLVFPNFSEQPIFAQPGKAVDIEGDASHLKELKVTGTEENELMTKFREQIAQASPPEIKKYIRQFIEDHPQSEVGLYLVRRYYVATAEPDFAEAEKLLAIMQKKQPENAQLLRAQNLIAGYAKMGKNGTLPNFTDYDIDGRLVSAADLSGTLAVVCTWATWNYDSTDQLRRLKDAQRKSNGRLKVVGICLDASKKDCERRVKQDSITWPTICDGQLLEGRTVKQLGLLGLPDNIFVKNGRIVARSVPNSNLQSEIDRHL